MRKHHADPARFFPFRRASGPEFYRMTCPECGFARTCELERDRETVRDSDGGRRDDPEIVAELPAVCPKCGAKLRKEKIPVRIVR